MVIKMGTESLNSENEVFNKFLFYAGIVLLKTLLMSLLTARIRLQRKVFPTPEDYGRNPPETLTLDADVDRIRRIHLNDLENILPFVLIGILYMLTGPDVWYATLYFRIFTGSRLLHTLVYLWAVPQPSRALCFMAGFIVSVLMLIAVIKAGSY